jgi:glycosyltransferase involved in cell wall biosynthesis
MARVALCRQLSAGIVANSRHTLEVLSAFAGKQNWQLPPAVVAPLAPGLPVLPAGPRPFPQPYFLVLGTIEPRKNHWMLLQLWRRLHGSMGNGAPRLVVIGQRGWECENVVDLLERCEQLQGIVIERSACSDVELNTWLHHAQALLFPSFAEGYGLPLAEALAHHVPVICSELPVFREIAGEIPEYVDPLDGARWETLVREYAIPESPMRADQILRIANYRATTWPQHFALVDAFLRDLNAGSSESKHG